MGTSGREAEDTHPAAARLEETRPTGNGRTRGLVSCRRSGSRVDARTFAPPDGLRGVVERLWVGRWDLPDDAPHVTRLLGDPCLNLVWETSAQDAPPERLVGVWTRIWERRLEGRGVARGITLRAGAAREIVEDAATLRNAVVPLDQAISSPPRAAHLSPAPEQDLSVLQHLTAWLDTVRRRDPDTALAVRVMARLRADPSILRVDQLARAAGLGERSLQRLFRSHVGASPKQVLRRVRLQEAASRLEREDYPSLADLAFDLGYADQAHFARDWKDAVAVSPAAFARHAQR